MKPYQRATGVDVTDNGAWRVSGSVRHKRIEKDEHVRTRRLCKKQARRMNRKIATEDMRELDKP